MAAPVATPAMRVKPPLTSGFSTARMRTLCTFNSGDGERAFVNRSLCRRSRRVTGGGKRGFVVWMIRYFLHVFGVADCVIPVDHEDGAALDAEFLDQRSVIRAEGAVFVVAQHLDPVHLEIVAPSLLCEGKVHAHGDDVHVRQFGRLFVEAL